ncbi:hypothetical protein BGY98DRAFT_1019172 [Russula aff. rugulosa BPL654]|nr:hypothetical protein BGY98DRAFT_1019172 [Russula aff. rugulosa BPL654]
MIRVHSHIPISAGSYRLLRWDPHRSPLLLPMVVPSILSKLKRKPLILSSHLSPVSCT